MTRNQALQLLAGCVLAALGAVLLCWGLAPLGQRPTSPHHTLRGGYQVVFPVQQRYVDFIRRM